MTGTTNATGIYVRKLILLYGPPAVGKLTVGSSLAAKVDAVLFHNHLTYDLAASVLTPDRCFETIKMFSCQLRLHAISLLFGYDSRGVVTTFCYSGAKDDWYIDALRTLCQDHGAVPHFVQLRGDRAHLLDRVENPDRKKFGKICSRDKLTEILDDCSYSATIAAVNHISLNMSELTPHCASERLAEVIYRSSKQPNIEGSAK
ncbi:AAA family ATPase (plasmid) [Ralstonia syzygii subsp. celebesensis]|uniref:AAA family ATPase n=2 Tax=Ralstonia solanacearum species complex TaxID=3116862 RepID=A0AAD0SD98_RALSL|nr:MULTISPECIES: AAA family ATPase [Ralstonia solanacearum species complex]CCA82455.1 conserved hypothethical protein [blood disease bacterium R229]AXV84519.1 AAA family ATPase [Ralstonia solanacearum]AXW55647.1 AAA family ATPase [Ralstonia solanacearum]QQV57181.1 AAA family ATPase [Ralstonia syzygii subsp. celebesensis]CBJ35888.1 conserved hypothethical protein [Ralstonia solanacearum PSI07]